MTTRSLRPYPWALAVAGALLMADSAVAQHVWHGGTPHPNPGSSSHLHSVSQPNPPAYPRPTPQMPATQAHPAPAYPAPTPHVHAKPAYPAPTPHAPAKQAHPTPTSHAPAKQAHPTPTPSVPTKPANPAPAPNGPANLGYPAPTAAPPSSAVPGFAGPGQSAAGTSQSAQTGTATGFSVTLPPNPGIGAVTMPFTGSAQLGNPSGSGISGGGGFRPAAAQGQYQPGSSVMGYTTTTHRSTALIGLHHARKLLQATNHDDNGYRAQALNQVHQAIRALSPSWQQPTNGAGNAYGAQANADAQMRQALEYLQAAAQTLQGYASQAPGAGAANTHVVQAIQHLQNALSSR